MTDIERDPVNVLTQARDLAELNPRFSFEDRVCHNALIAFLENNRYFGAQRINIREENSATEGKGGFLISCDDAIRIRPNIELWIRSYGAGSDEKLKLLTERLVVLYPHTGKLFSAFVEQNESGSSAAWKLADYLCFVLHKEIIEMDNKELDSIAAGMDKELPLGSARMFSAFLMYIREQGWLPNGWMYSFNSRLETEIQTNGAYTVPDFLKMAYIVFNDEAWEREGILEKALQDEKDANMWLFVALHFICGWRGTDILRLPLPIRPCEGAKMRELIVSASFDATYMIDELEYRLRWAPLTPKKTEVYENVPELKLFIPQSLRKPIGIILAVAASYHDSVKPGENFLRKPKGKSYFQSFFGRDFIDACGDRGFSSRRANKSYLQGIEMMVSSSPGKPKGYMLAALARSHKGGFGTLPETTDIYLRDAKFSGYRPEFIAQEMFERGVFSFIPALMLEMYAKDDYTELPVSFQTKVIAEIGIDASGLEGLAKTVELSLVQARNSIAEIMKRPEDMRGSIVDILQNIASGNAPGRQEGFLCLMTAAGAACFDAGRSSCVGCGYEIYTKTILHCLSKEYARLLLARDRSEPAQAERYTKILKEAVMPAISEMFASIKEMYPDADIKSLINTVEKGGMLC